MRQELPIELINGREVVVLHPFIQETVSLFGEDGHYEALSWRPGVRFEQTAPDDSEAFADAIGSQILTVVSLHRPGKYPERVFYTRQWRDPNGKLFGKAKLRVTTTGAFRRLINGYRYPYRMAEQKAA